VRKYFPSNNLSQTHELLEGKYFLTTTVLNNSDQNLPVNFAEHFYWHAPNGWEGVKVNGDDVTDVAKKDSSINLLSENVIEIPGQKHVMLQQKGFSIFRLWAYKNPQTGEYDKNYVCIEPAEGDPNQNFFGSEKSIIKSHKSRITEIVIKLNEFK
jgi:galactose mutarotase-like enzyme